MPAFRSSAFTRWRLPRLRLRTSNCSLSFIYLPRRNERLSWPGWLTYSGRFTHISDHPSAAGRAQDREISPVKDQRSTALPRNRHCQVLNCHIRHFQRAPTKRMIVLAQKSQPPDVFLRAANDHWFLDYYADEQKLVALSVVLLLVNDHLCLTMCYFNIWHRKYVKV